MKKRVKARYLSAEDAMAAIIEAHRKDHERRPLCSQPRCQAVGLIKVENERWLCRQHILERREH